jgi:immunoglobulin-binding protein 1
MGRYLLINYRLAELILRVSSKDRKTKIQKAREAYERYLSLLDHYEILSTADKKLYHSYTEAPTTFSTISTTDPNARRAAKIANFKQEKELKKKLEVCLYIYKRIRLCADQETVLSTKPSLPPKR